MPERLVWEERAFSGDFDAIPKPFLWSDTVPFAYLVDGYKEAGGFGSLGGFAIARAEEAERTGVWRGTALELWLCLFFERRRWNHYGDDPEGEDLNHLNRLCETLRRELCNLSARDRQDLASRLKPLDSVSAQS